MTKVSSKPEYLDELIERASGKAGSDYKLAKMLDVPRQRVSNWRHGKQTCPVADVALMADIAGLDAQAWHARATVEQYAGTPKGDKLYRALGKALAATGAVLVSSGASATVIFSTAELNNNIVLYFIRCIQVLTRRRELVIC